MTLQTDILEIRTLTASLHLKLRGIRNKQVKASKRMPSKSQELAEAENTIKGTRYAINRLENCLANMVDVSLELKQQNL